MTELENKIGMQQEPSKEEQHSALQKAMSEHLAKGNKVTRIESKEPKQRKRKKGSVTKPIIKTTSGGRKPVLTAWKMLNVKIGTKLVWLEGKGKINVKVSAEVLDDISMKLKVNYGKKSKVVDGLMRGEIFILQSMKKPVPKKPQGWDRFGIESNDKVKSIHSMFDAVERETLINRRGY